MDELVNGIPRRMWKAMIFSYLQAQQEEYDEYWVRNLWGFGDKMRDYLLEGRRRIRFEYGKKEPVNTVAATQ